MTTISLKDILINARQESYRMRHYYVGVEHLFIALLEIRAGLAASLLEDQGLTTDYVIDAVRRQVGKGGKQRLWAGIPNTPRADIVMGIAHDLALEDNREEINERDLLVAIFDENSSIPVRVLRRLGIDVQTLAQEARERPFSTSSEHPYLRVNFGPEFDVNSALDDHHLFVLRRMFYGYGQLRIEKQLTGGYSGATLLVVTPIRADGMEDAAVVVKIDQADRVLDEALRYERYVKSSLPPLTARLEDRPTVPETSDLAGLKYTFVASEGRSPQDLRDVVGVWPPDDLSDWLRDRLFPVFGRTWWQQRRPFRFQAWAEYDWLLPPVLTLERIDNDEPPEGSQIIKEPLKRGRLEELEYGDVVVIENFTVQRVYPERDAIQLASGRGMEAARRAHKIEVRGLRQGQDTFFRGEVVERLVGRVWKTRAEQLLHAASALSPTFDLHDDMIPGLHPGERLPNPILAYHEVLDYAVNGSISTIHGDLHLGNILVGPNNSPFLIDFAQTRDGHTLFDWACLEVSLLGEVLMPALGQDWAAARTLLELITALNDGDGLPEGTPASLAWAMSSVEAVRDIVHACLAEIDRLEEYFTALALCALRAITWEKMSLGSRRLMFLLAALTI